MKRAREAYEQEEDDDEVAIDSSDDEAQALAVADHSSNSSDSEEESTTRTAVDLGEAVHKTPLLELLRAVLLVQQPNETVAATLGRLSLDRKQHEEAFNTVTDNVVKCAVQHDLQLLPMQREAICRRAKIELLAQTNVHSDTLSPLWVLKWVKDAKETIHGPFTPDTMDAWRAAGFFAKKEALVSNANCLDQPRLWTPASHLNSFVSF